MEDFLQRLRQRKIVQWTIAYVAFWFALLQGVDIVAARFDWPAAIERCFILALAIGFCATLVLAWYHGERGAQRIGGMEIMILAVLLAIGGGLLWRFGPAKAPHAQAPAAAVRPPAAAISAQPIPAKSIAVLPFENLSNDKDNEYFVAGMQDLILTKLADIGDLKVISRTSTEKYKSRPGDLEAIGRQLGVATILEGSVQKAGDQVLINVQLIDTRTDNHVWAQDYTRTLDNIFGVEGEVAGRIANALHARLSPAQGAQLVAAPTTNRAAYDAFLHAEYQYHKGFLSNDVTVWKAALPLYRQAIAADPKFALAFARLSITESILVYRGYAGDDAAQLKTQARADAEQALKLQPALSPAQLALGYSDYYGYRDYAGALRAFAAALKLRPNDAEALSAQGYVQRRVSQFDAAIASLTRAVALDPRNFLVNLELGNTYMMVGRYREAEPWLERAMAIEPDSAAAKFRYSDAIFAGSGDVPRALSVAQGDDPSLKTQRAFLLGVQRKFPDAIALIQGMPDTPDNFDPGASKAGSLAFYFWVEGDKARARELYAKALPLDRAALSRVHGFELALAWANVARDLIGTGQTRKALAAIAIAQATVATSPDVIVNTLVFVDAAQAYAMAARADLAVPLLARVLATRGTGLGFAPVALWLLPAWDPIRNDPRFQALQRQYAKYKPAVTYDSAPSASASSTVGRQDGSGAAHPA